MNYLGGYPINIPSLSNGDILYFNGQEWIGIVEGTQPTFYSLVAPSTSVRQSPVFDSIPVVIDALQPNQVLFLRKRVIIDAQPRLDDLRVDYNLSRHHARDSGELIFWMWSNGDYPDPSLSTGHSSATFSIVTDGNQSHLAPVPVNANFSTSIEPI